MENVACVRSVFGNSAQKMYFLHQKCVINFCATTKKLKQDNKNGNKYTFDKQKCSYFLENELKITIQTTQSCYLKKLENSPHQTCAPSIGLPIESWSLAPISGYWPRAVQSSTFSKHTKLLFSLRQSLYQSKNLYAICEIQ